MNSFRRVKARINVFIAAFVMLTGPLLMTLAAAPAHAGAIRALTSAPAVGARASMFGRIVTGAQHSCVLAGDGAVRCWGSNSSGQLGDGTTQSRSLPVTVPGITTAVAISAGENSTCALLVNGTVRCWGDNSFGQLGDGTTVLRVQPVTVSGLTDAVALTVGYRHACAVRTGGAIVCWGNNFYGQLGDGTGNLADRPTPVAVTGVSAVRSVAAGALHTCALLADGSVRCWGDNQYGQLGRGDTQPTLSKSTVSNLNRVAALSSGGRLSCALQADGQVHCWGSSVNANVPTPVTGLADAAAIATGLQHACAVRVNGSTVCWGVNDFGQLGSGSFTASTTPVQVSGLSNVAVVAAGQTYSCALMANGRVACWGLNNVGQLGDGSTTSSPTAVLAAYSRLTTAIALEAGSSHTCAVRADGPGACLGRNASRQLGNNSTTDSPSAVAVSQSQNWLKVVGGQDHSCALRADGAVQCWGPLNLTGDGVGGSGTRGSPGATVVGISNAVDLVAGSNHTCAVLVDGTARCWGIGLQGRLGNGQEIGFAVTPQAVVALTDAIELTAGAVHTCANQVNGTVQCWGEAASGKLGNGTVSPNQLSPVAVSGLSNVIAVDAGGSHNCALRADGLVRCWGANGAGQLGDGTTNASSLPVPVAPITAANAVSTGGAQSCVQLASGQARCWGLNDRGQLGDGTTTSPRLTPVAPSRQVTATIAGRTTTSTVPLDTVVAISAGGSHTCSLHTYGAPWCWGRNAEGQAGTGAFTTSSNYAREVASFRFNVFPSVTVRRPGRIATITALLTCEEGQDAVVELKLTQGETVARAQRRVSCLNGLERYPVDAPTLGQGRFVDGPALAEAEVVIYERGQPIEEQRWQRQVTVSHES